MSLECGGTTPLFLRRGTTRNAATLQGCAFGVRWYDTAFSLARHDSPFYHSHALKRYGLCSCCVIPQQKTEQKWIKVRHTLPALKVIYTFKVCSSVVGAALAAIGFVIAYRG